MAATTFSVYTFQTTPAPDDEIIALGTLGSNESYGVRAICAASTNFGEGPFSEIYEVVATFDHNGTVGDVVYAQSLRVAHASISPNPYFALSGSDMQLICQGDNGEVYDLHWGVMLWITRGR